MPEPGLAEQLTGWAKKIQRFSDSLPSLGMRTAEQEAARQKRLKQAAEEDAASKPMEKTPKPKGK